MKASKLIYLLALSLVLSLGATGCKKKPIGVTDLPNGAVGSGRLSQPPAGLTPTPPFNADSGLNSRNEIGGHDTSSSWDPADPNLQADRSTFSANTVHFDFDSAAIKSSDRGNVTAVAAGLKADINAKLLVEGHCDERGTEEYNRSLGERRALAIREALTAEGIDPERIRTVSFGEDKPAVQGHDESAYSQNRRGEFVVYRPR